MLWESPLIGSFETKATIEKYSIKTWNTVSDYTR